MIFAATYQKVLAGTKTQTRRLVGRENCRYRVRRVYAVQPERCHFAVCHIEILEVRRERLGDITDDDARLEGFADRDDFIAGWTELHGSCDVDRDVWVITFKKVTKPNGKRKAHSRGKPDSVAAIPGQ